MLRHAPRQQSSIVTKFAFLVQISSQALYLLHVLPSGRLVPLHTLGQHCRDDDALVIADQRHAEQHAQQARLRQLQARVEHPPGLQYGCYSGL